MKKVYANDKERKGKKIDHACVFVLGYLLCVFYLSNTSLSQITISALK